jgi:S1-C subfamily serine protease
MENTPLDPQNVAPSAPVNEVPLAPMSETPSVPTIEPSPAGITEAPQMTSYDVSAASVNVVPEIPVEAPPPFPADAPPTVIPSEVTEVPEAPFVISEWAMPGVNPLPVVWNVVTPTIVSQPIAIGNTWNSMNPPSWKKYWMYGVGLLILLGIGGAAFFLMGSDEEENMTLNSAPPPEVVSGESLTIENEMSQSGSKTENEEEKKKIHKVFKLKTYKQWIDGKFNYISYGSAIYIGEKRILTNAHVVLWSDDTPTGKYNICLTEIDAEKPTCVSALKLLKYDTTKDIALLELVEDVYLGEPVSLEDVKPSLWDAIKVYGYPSNGGETLSFTEGKMSGTEKWYYKIDANIDHGNSGGGAFNKDDEFIGMPFSAQVGLTTMGYIIPIKSINDFLSGKWDIEEYSKDEDLFAKFINNSNTQMTTWKIENPFFEFLVNGDSGFSVNDIEVTPEWYGSYTFTSESEKTYIIIDIPYIVWNTYFPFSWGLKEIEKLYTSVKYGLDEEVYGIQTQEMLEVSGAKKYNGGADDNIAMYAYRVDGVDFIIETEAHNGEKEDIESAKNLFSENFTVTLKNAFIEKNTLEIYSGSMTLPKWSYALRSCGTRCIYKVRLDPESEVGVSSYANDLEELEGLSLEDVKKQSEKMYSEYSLGENEFAIKKNKNNHEYLSMKATNQKWESVLWALFYGKESDEKYTEYTFTMKLWKSDKSIEDKFSLLVDSVSLTLDTPFGVTKKKVAIDESKEAPESEQASEDIEESAPEEEIPQKTEPKKVVEEAKSDSNINYCETKLNGITYTLNPCSIDETMVISEGDTSFEYSIVPSDKSASYSYSVYGYGEWFPTYGILWGTSWGASWVTKQNPYFNSTILKEWEYSGYLKIQVNASNGAKARELRLKINLSVTK